MIFDIHANPSSVNGIESVATGSGGSGSSGSTFNVTVTFSGSLNTSAAASFVEAIGQWVDIEDSTGNWS